MTTTTIDEERLHQFLGKMVGFMTGGALCMGIWLGEQLGLYRALVEGGPAGAETLVADGHTLSFACSAVQGTDLIVGLYYGSGEAASGASACTGKP